MFSKKQLNGQLMPDKTLCLTFDDGPGETIGEGSGPKTLKIGHYLKDENISATFFMVGKFAGQFPTLLPELFNLGHTIANHTYNHVNIVNTLKKGCDLITEFTRTDDLIKEFVPNNTVYFRAPWGEWPSKAAEILNKKLDNGLRHIGPIHWDIDCEDWSYWARGCKAEECAEAYLTKIFNLRKGIVLMHDSTADILGARISNLTFETIKIIVPILKGFGYKFVSLDEAIKL
jgi:peptidoglycan/xylan/chitin deacetylase (PgdA/CDA1 family)